MERQGPGVASCIALVRRDRNGSNSCETSWLQRVTASIPIRASTKCLNKTIPPFHRSASHLLSIYHSRSLTTAFQIRNSFLTTSFLKIFFLTFATRHLLFSLFSSDPIYLPCCTWNMSYFVGLFCTFELDKLSWIFSKTVHNISCLVALPLHVCDKLMLFMLRQFHRAPIKP